MCLYPGVAVEGKTDADEQLHNRTNYFALFVVHVLLLFCGHLFSDQRLIGDMFRMDWHIAILLNLPIVFIILWWIRFSKADSDGTLWFKRIPKDSLTNKV
jgi:hypothetical protein